MRRARDGRSVSDPLAPEGPGMNGYAVETIPLRLCGSLRLCVNQAADEQRLDLNCKEAAPLPPP